MGINLNKGQSIDLRKSDGGGLTQVRMGLGWDAKVTTKRGLFGGTKTIVKAIDLDASALLCGNSEVKEIVYFGQLRSSDGALQHTGDNRTGLGEGDDESILVNLPGVSPTIDTIYFVVNSYSGETFTEIENATVRVVDSTNQDEELARYSLASTGPHTALVMAKVERSGSGWSMTAIGHPGQGRRAADLIQLIQSASL